MKIQVTKIYDITRCYNDCPYFGLDGGPGASMVCNHPKAPRGGYIIFHPDCMTFPKECPIKIYDVPFG